MKRLKSFVIIGLSFLIVVFLIYFFFGGTQIYNDEDNFLSINRFLIWCLGYIFCFIVGLCFRFYEDGGELEPEEAKNIRAWKAQKSKDKGVYKEKITLSDKLFFKWGHPLDVSKWDFEEGFVNWLVQVPFMGFGVLAVGALAGGLIIMLFLIPVGIFNYFF